MATTFDALAVVVFAALAALYLHRSSRPAPDPTPFWGYALAAAACALANGFGNHGRPVLGLLLLAGAAAFVLAASGALRAR